MANGWEVAAGAGFGLMGAGLQLWEGNQKYLNQWTEWNQQAQATIRQNQRQALQISEANKRTGDIYGYQTGRFKQNLGFIGEEYNRAGEDLQRELQGAFAQSAYSRQSQLQALAQASGYNSAAYEGSSRSRERADLLATVGTFGRNQAMEAERLAGVVSQTDRNRGALGRQAKQSVFTAWGDLGILPELQKYYGQEIGATPMKQNQWLDAFSATSKGIADGVSMMTSLAGAFR